MKTLEKLLSDYHNLIKFISGTIILITFLIVADNYISDKIDEKITDDTYISELAKILRPFLIADEKGTITYDHGGEKYVEKIVPSKNKHGDFESVTITTKIFLKEAPLVNIIDTNNYLYRNERISTYEWKIHAGSASAIMDSYGTTENFHPIMVIEILK